MQRIGIGTEFYKKMIDNSQRRRLGRSGTDDTRRESSRMVIMEWYPSAFVSAKRRQYLKR